MGKTWTQINEYTRDMIAKQQVYFVATAPLSARGHINISPKGHGPATFAILNNHQVAFLDLTGSGNETISHVKENARIVFMFCSFDQTPCIIRLWGTGRVYENGTPGFYSYMSKAFGPDSPNGKAYAAHPGFSAGARSVIVADIYQVSTACGFGVPLMTYKSDRDTLIKWSAEQGPEGMKKYQKENNQESLDGLRGLTLLSGGSSSLAAYAASVTALAKDNTASLALVAAGAVAGAAVATALCRRH